MEFKLLVFTFTAFISLNIGAIKRKSHEFIPISRFTLRDIKNNTDKPAYIAMNRVGSQTGVRQDIEIPAKTSVSLLEPLALKDISNTMTQTQKIEIAPYYDSENIVPDLLILTVTKEEYIPANDPQRKSVQIKADLVVIDPMNDQELGRISSVNKDYLLTAQQRDYYLIDIILTGKDLQESKIAVTQQVINP